MIFYFSAIRQIYPRQLVLVNLLQDYEARVGVFKYFHKLGLVPVADSFGVLVLTEQAVKDIGTQRVDEIVHLVAAAIDNILLVPSVKPRLKNLVGNLVPDPLEANVEVLSESRCVVFVIADGALFDVLVMDALAMNLANEAGELAVVSEDKLNVSVDMNGFRKALAVVQRQKFFVVPRGRVAVVPE